MCHLFVRKKVDRARVYQARWDGGQTICSCAGNQIILLQRMVPKHVLDSLGGAKWATFAFIQVPPLQIPGVRFRGDGGLQGRRTLKKTKTLKETFYFKEHLFHFKEHFILQETFY